MPELPDVELYLHALRRRVVGRTLVRVKLLTPFLLRSVAPPIGAVAGRRIVAVERLGKRIVFELAAERSAAGSGERSGERGDESLAALLAPSGATSEPSEPLFLVLHLMIAGRLQWADAGGKAKAGRHVLAHFEIGAADGHSGTAVGSEAAGDDAAAPATLTLTEAGTKKRAALHVVAGRAGLAAHDPGGIDPLTADRAAFRAALTRENHTIKRALTDPRALSGIGNAYSDEILWRAQLSPYLWTERLDEAQLARLHDATRATLAEWRDRLIAETGEQWPAKVTAFRPEMAVHGRYGEPCPKCQAPVQRIVRADHETNYCARCQTGGKVLADRALSQLLKDDWPRTLEEWEALKGGGAG
ncbi:MAG: formamidopyrimidine-DNA glycosylase [Planctomycetes bacterium]|nr:formamidopyrimidine-DNA glycosylase [Planctomycetota bacterium]